MATTTRGIETPDLGTAYNPPVDLAHMADTIDTIVSGLEDVNTERSNYGVGTTSERTAALASFPDGALWYDTTLSAEYRKVAGAWVANTPSVTPGTIPMIPSSVAGTGVTVSGSRIVLSGATGTINLNDLFSSTYKHYMVKMRLKVTSGGSVGLLLRASGTDSTSGYDRQRLSGVSTTPAAAQALNTGSWELVAALLSSGVHTVSLDLSFPADADYTTGAFIASSVDTPMTTAAGVNNAAIGHRTASAYTGLSLALSSSTATGYITVTAVNS